MNTDMVEKLRQMWIKASPGERIRIETVAEVVKTNPKFGSTEYEGNGYCYTCYLEKARPGSFTCDTCSGAIKTEQEKLSVKTIIERTRNLGTKDHLT